MKADLVPMDTLRSMTAPADLFVGTGQARPVSVRNVVAFSRMRAKDLGERKNMHHRFVLCVNLHASASIQLALNNVAYRLGPGRYSLLFPHQLHAFGELDDREIAILFITFETDDDEMLAGLNGRILEMTPPVKTALRSFIYEYTDSRPTRNDKLVVLASQALLETIIMNDSDSGVDASIMTPPPLKRAMTAISGERIPTVVAMSKEAGLSEAYLRKLFKRHMGLSLGRYLTEMRQNKARSLLGASDESVSKIAELCGYASIYAFSRSFHSFNDCTPSGYRARSRSDDRPRK